MTLKSQIVSDFITAMKNRNVFEKDTLNLIKAKITEKEKATSGETLTDAQVIDILTSMVKQRNQTIDSYKDIEKNDRINEAIELEQKQIKIIEKYLPQQMTEAEIITLATDFLATQTDTPANKKLGAVMGHFKTKFAGEYDASKLKLIVDKIISA